MNPFFVGTIVFVSVLGGALGGCSSARVSPVTT
jgi:hypothetical protein